MDVPLIPVNSVNDRRSPSRRNSRRRQRPHRYGAPAEVEEEGKLLPVDDDSPDGGFINVVA